MVQEAGIAALAWCERKNVVADDALQPLDAVVTSHSDFAAMGKIGKPHSFAHGSMFRRYVSVMGWDFPAGDFFEGRAKMYMLAVEQGVSH